MTSTYRSSERVRGTLVLRDIVIGCPTKAFTFVHPKTPIFGYCQSLAIIFNNRCLLHSALRKTKNLILLSSKSTSARTSRFTLETHGGAEPIRFSLDEQTDGLAHISPNASPHP